MAEPLVSSTGSPYIDDSSEVSQSSTKYQQLIVSKFPDGGPIMSKLPFGGPVDFNWPLSNAWFGFGVGEHFPPLTSGSPFLATIIPPSPHRLLEDLTVGSNMDSFSPTPSEGIPTSGEDYQLFPEDIPEPSFISSPGPTLPAGYRSLSQVMATIASIGVFTPSTRPTIPLLGMFPSTPLTTSPCFTSTPVRPTICMAMSMPIVTTQSTRTSSVPEDMYIDSAILENISPEEYRLSLQPSNSDVGQSSQDLNHP